MLSQDLLGSLLDKVFPLQLKLAVCSGGQAGSCPPLPRWPPLSWHQTIHPISLPLAGGVPTPVPPCRLTWPFLVILLTTKAPVRPSFASPSFSLAKICHFFFPKSSGIGEGRDQHSLSCCARTTEGIQQKDLS